MAEDKQPDPSAPLVMPARLSSPGIATTIREGLPLPQKNVLSAASAAFNLSARLQKATVITPVASYHVDSTGNHAPGYNESNPGIGLKLPVTDTGVVSAVFMDYRNSYANMPRFEGDHTQVMGVEITPQAAQLDVGRLRASAGLLVGVAHTDRGSYVAAMPEISSRNLNLTAMAAMTVSLEHKDSGIGLQAMAVPPVGPRGVGFVGLAMTKKF